VRTLFLVLLLACGFGAAALWQQSRVQRLREERALAARISAGDVALTPSGALGKDEAVVVIGRPAGGSAAAKPELPPPREPEAPPKIVTPAPPPGDFVLDVTAGQSLSQIAHAHYGHAPVELVTKLARYNGLTDANALRAGMTIKLPTLEKLGVELK
jgi:nucleoid-associated protein YgaU